MAEQPTRGADADVVGRWQGRPNIARGLRLVALLLPPLISGVGTWLLRAYFWQPPGLFGWVIWLAQLGTVGVLLALATERCVRRLVPLSELLRLSLVFPDKAPSRYGVALRTGTVRQQQKVIDTVLDHGFSSDEVEAFQQLVVLVMALGRHERLTRGHTERVRAYSDLIGAEMALPRADREKLHWAALLHDVGKLAVPAELLSLPGRPDEDQWEIIKQHPAIGARMVEPFAEWLGDWRRAAGDHHERWDGGGYPNGVAGLNISLAGRIVAVADAYDVITSSRSYKQAMSHEAARAELVRCAGAQFDPAVVRAMLRVSTGDLHTRAGRFGWVGALQGMTSSIGQAAVVPLTAAAGILGVPLVAEGLSLVEELAPFEVTASGLAPEDKPGPLPIPDGTDNLPAADEGPKVSDLATPTPTGKTDEPPTADVTPLPTAKPTPPTIEEAPPPTATPPPPTDGQPTPTVQVPTVQVPTVQVPTVQIPPIAIPTVQIPTVQVPPIEVPTVQVPTVVPLPTPSVSIPQPTVQVPTVAVPTLPTVPGLPGG